MDHKSNYIQSYTSEIAEGFKWAKDCALRMNGRIDEITKSDTGETALTIFSVSLKK